MQAVDAILAELYGVQSTSQAHAAPKQKEPRHGMHRCCHSASTARSTADQTPRAAAMSATGRILITDVITRAAR